MTIRRYYSNKDYHSVGIITDDDHEELAFCEVCQRNGELSKLKERIYLDDNGKLLPNHLVKLFQPIQTNE
jgi:hypothetical protein